MAPRVTIRTDGNAVKFLTGVAKIAISKEFYTKAGNEVVASIGRNVQGQVQSDGNPLKRNAPSTREAKRRRGGRQRALVDRVLRFIRKSYWSVKVSKKGATIQPRARDDFRAIAGYVQEKGYTGWFGLDKAGVRNLRKALREEVETALKKARP